MVEEHCEARAQRDDWLRVEIRRVTERALEWVDWFHMRRPLGRIGELPPAEFEAHYYAPATVA